MSFTHSINNIPISILDSSLATYQKHNIYEYNYLAYKLYMHINLFTLFSVQYKAGGDLTVDFLTYMVCSTVILR